MAIFPWFYSLISKSYRYDSVRRLKSVLRPLKHALFGKSGIYQIIDVVGELEKKAGREVKVVFDIGASVGDTAATLLRAFPHAEVYCFEPLGDSFRCLTRRISGFGSRVKCFHLALSNKNGKADFYISKNADSSSLIAPLQEAVGKVERVELVRLDDFVEKLGIKRIDFVKIDVEGAEKELIEGGMNTFTNLVDNVFVEILPFRRGARSRAYIDVFENLYKAGFSFAGVYGDFFFTKLL